MDMDMGITGTSNGRCVDRLDAPNWQHQSTDQIAKVTHAFL